MDQSEIPRGEADDRGEPERRISFSPGTLISLGLLVVAVFGLVFQRAQLQIERERRASEQKGPELVFSTVWDVQPTEEDLDAVNNAIDALYEAFFTAVADYLAEHPDESYVSAIEARLPIRITLPSLKAGSLTATVKNIGEKPEKAIRVSVRGDTPIADYSVAASEPWEVMQGGKEETHILLEIERLVQGDQLTVTVIFEADTEVGQSVELRRREATFATFQLAEGLAAYWLGLGFHEPEDVIFSVKEAVEVLYFRQAVQEAPVCRVTSESGPAESLDQVVRTGIEEYLWEYKYFRPSEWIWGPEG